MSVRKSPQSHKEHKEESLAKAQSPQRTFFQIVALPPRSGGHSEKIQEKTKRLRIKHDFLRESFIFSCIFSECATIWKNVCGGPASRFANFAPLREIVSLLLCALCGFVVNYGATKHDAVLWEDTEGGFTW
jgi:hypothetical protein